MTTRPVQSGPGVVQRAIRGTASKTPCDQKTEDQATRFMPSRIPDSSDRRSALASPREDGSQSEGRTDDIVNRRRHEAVAWILAFLSHWQSCLRCL